MRQDIVQTLWDFYIIHADLGASQYEEVLEQISTKYDRRREELAEILRVFSLQPMYTTHNTPAQQSQLPLRRQEDTRHMSLSDEASVLVALQGDVHGDIRLGDFESIRSLLGVYLRGIEDTCKKWSFSVILEPQETSLQFMNGIEQMYIPTEVTVLNAPEAILPSDSHYLTEAIAANQRLVLLGETGSGKSTALRYLAMVLCRAYQYVCFDKTEALDKHPHSRTNFKRDDPQPLLPMFLTAAKLAQELKKHKTLEPQDILSLLLRQHISDPERYPSFVDFMKEKVRNGRVLLLLDGLDEIADDRMFYRVQRLVYEFADVYQRCRILVSMRTSTQVRKRQRKVEGDSSYQEMPLYCWPTASIVSWSISRMECYIDIWHRLSSQPSQALGGSAHELKGLLATRLDLQQLAANPLLLAVLVIAHTKSKASVERKTAIYKRFLILLMDRWERLVVQPY